MGVHGGGGRERAKSKRKLLRETKRGKEERNKRVWGKSAGLKWLSEKARTSEAHFLLILPFSDSWLTGSLNAASSEGGEPPESDSFFARDEGISVQQREGTREDRGWWYNAEVGHGRVSRSVEMTPWGAKQMVLYIASLRRRLSYYRQP